MRNSWVIYRSFYEAWSMLSDEQKWEYYEIIFKYMFDFEIVEAKDKMVGAMFKLIKPQIEANIKKYKNWCKQKISKTEAKNKQNESKTEGNVNVDDNVNEDVDVNEDISNSVSKDTRSPWEREIVYTLESFRKRFWEIIRFYEVRSYMPQIARILEKDEHDYWSKQIDCLWKLKKKWYTDEQINNALKHANDTESRHQMMKSIQKLNKKSKNTWEIYIDMLLDQFIFEKKNSDTIVDWIMKENKFTDKQKECMIDFVKTRRKSKLEVNKKIVWNYFVEKYKKDFIIS